MYDNYRSYIIWKQPFANVLHLRVLKNFAKFTRKHMCRNVLIRLLDVGQQLYQKETPAQLSSREFCETFKNTFFTDHLWTTASVLYYNALYISNISYLYSVNISPRYKKILDYVLVPVNPFFFGPSEELWKLRLRFSTSSIRNNCSCCDLSISSW